MKLRIHIKNFRAIKNTQLNINSGVNILIGPNGSGKSTLFLALKFLRDVLLHGVGLAVAKGGGARRTYRRGESKISFEVEYDFDKERIFRRRRVPFTFVWEIDISQRGAEGISTIIRERTAMYALKDGERFNVFDAEIRRNRKGPRHSLRLAAPLEIGKDIFSYLIHQAASENKVQAFNMIKGRFNDILKQAKKNNDKSFFPGLARYDDELSHLHSSFLNLNEYNILPDIARQSTDQLPVVEMLPNGGNLSEVIHALENKNFHKITGSRIYADDYASPYYFGLYYAEPLYYGASAYRSRRKEVSLKDALANINSELATAVKPIQEVSAKIDLTNGKRFVVFKAGKDTFYPEEVSDGTMKWLCILVSIYVPFSQLYLLEEPENFLHPWMQQKLIHLMRKQARSTQTIFLLTTHSTAILNTAKPHEVVVVKATTNGTTANSMHAHEDLQSLLTESNFGLGDLWVSGGLGAVPGEND